MGGAQHRSLDGDARVVGAQQHGAAGVEARGRREHPLEVRFEKPKGFAREHLRKGGAPGAHEALDRVREGVVPGHGRDVPGLGREELRIEDGHAEGRPRIAAGHLDVRAASEMRA